MVEDIRGNLKVKEIKPKVDLVVNTKSNLEVKLYQVRMATIDQVQVGVEHLTQVKINLFN